MSSEHSSAQRVYLAVRDMAAAFAFKPNERINEGGLARDLGTSRTPLREALNRLAAEGFLTFQAGQGFYCRSLDPADILDIYEARQAVECEGARLATIRAGDAEIDALRDHLRSVADRYTGAASTEDLVELDEAFHMRVIALSGNRELDRILRNLNARLRFVCWIDMEERRAITAEDHARIVEALATRDPDAAAGAMRTHIHRRREQATETARKAFSRLYVGG